MAWRITEGGLDDPRVVALLARHVARARAAAAPESAHALDRLALRRTDVTFWSVWLDDTLVGTGALRAFTTDQGEVKSMHTAEALRGHGAGSAMLRHIAATARSRGMRRLSLETGAGPHFAAARRLYARRGFIECGPFGDYAADANSVFMTLAFDTTSRLAGSEWPSVG